MHLKLQDEKARKGICLVEPHSCIAKNNVLYLNSSRNMVEEAGTEDEKPILADDNYKLFKTQD